MIARLPSARLQGNAPDRRHRRVDGNPVTLIKRTSKSLFIAKCQVSRCHRLHTQSRATWSSSRRRSPPARPSSRHRAAVAPPRPPPPRRPKRTPRGQPPSRARSALAKRRNLDLPIRTARRRLGTTTRETWRGRRRETWRRSDATSASAPACASATTATSQTDGGLRTSARPSANDPGTYQSKSEGSWASVSLFLSPYVCGQRE